MEFFIVDVLDFFDGKFSSHWTQDFKDFDKAKRYALLTLKENGYDVENILTDTLAADNCWDENGKLLKNYTEFNSVTWDDEDRKQDSTNTTANHYWWAARIVIQEGEKQILGKMRITLHCYSI